MKILIVDDEPLVRRSLERVFKIKGHQVELAEDGRKGVEIWKAFRPDLILLDVLMPELTGPQVLETMGQEKSGKTVLISAFTGDYNLETARELGADLFIAKPFLDIFEVADECLELVKDKSL